MAEVAANNEWGICCAVPGKSQAWAWMRLGFAALIAGQTMAFSLGINLSPPSGTERTVLHSILAGSALLVFLLIGLPLLRESWRQALAGRMVIEQMFLLGIAGAYAASVYSSLSGVGAIYYELVAILLAIYTLGTLVMQSRHRAALQAAQSLRSQYDRCLRLLADGAVQEVATDEIRPGDRIVVPAACGIPVDGVIVSGTAFVRETAMTGGFFPVVRETGDRVLAGGYVLDSRIEIAATASGRERKLDLLLASIDRARDLPSHIQQEADRLVSWFLPVVLAISVLTFAGWSWLVNWPTGLFNALAVLVVACPCAMGLAMPIGIMSALNAFARRGLVARQGDFIEQLGRIDTVVFDKTGTLSEEALQLVEFKVFPGFTRAQLRAWLAALEEGSSHPIARAVHDWAGNEVHGCRTEQLQILPGAGIRGTVTDAAGTAREVTIGNASILAEPARAAADWQAGKEATATLQVLYVTVDGVLAAMTFLREHLRQSSWSTLQQLRELGLRVEVMSGDRTQWLQELGFGDARGELLPEQKADLVREMEAAGRHVLFVGDGINDSAAMAEASASIALVGGADLAREVSAAQLFGGNLAVIPWARHQALRVLQGIRANLWFAAAYNAVGIVLAVSGLLHPVLAATLMMLSSLWVTWRALKFGEKLQAEAADADGPTETAGYHATEMATPDDAVILPMIRESRAVEHEQPAWPRAAQAWAVALFMGMVLQGGWVVYLAGLTPLPASLAIFGFAVTGAALGLSANFWYQRPVLLLYASMLAVGNLGMVLGWWLDGLGGQAMPCCAPGMSGHGSAWFNWMNGGMILASLPLLFLIQVQPVRALRQLFNRPWWHALFCLGGMLLGMKLSMLVLAPLGMGHPLQGVLLAYMAMTLGMLIGMVVACKFYFKVLLGGVATT